MTAKKRTQTDAKPSRTSPTHAQPSPAAALISKARADLTMPDPSPEALAELRKLVEYNDACCGMRGRVRAERAVGMLRSLGWVGASRPALDSLCVRAFGRTSYGTP